MNPEEQAALFELVAYKCRVLSAKGSRENKPQSAARKRAADCYRYRRDQRSATGSRHQCSGEATQEGRTTGERREPFSA
jgi:hypothetical protein